MSRVESLEVSRKSSLKSLQASRKRVASAETATRLKLLSDSSPHLCWLRVLLCVYFVAHRAAAYFDAVSHGVDYNRASLDSHSHHYILRES